MQHIFAMLSRSDLLQSCMLLGQLSGLPKHLAAMGALRLRLASLRQA